ncbi:hypothetical protein [Kitasatospora sp. NPDC057198]|uniref:hypothetical protein n=1 Tax=Kitasatospora sp. NPDC057198 TaxID=3346046 RepID=UPI00362BB6B4
MDDITAPSRADRVRLYLDTLRARMDPAEFRVLGRLLPGAVASLAAPGTEYVIEVGAEDRAHLTPQVRDELLAVLSIVATGTLEHQLVDLGDGAVTVLDTAAASSPEAVGRMREWAALRRSGRAGV